MMAPNYFFVTTVKPKDNDPGAIAEGWFVVQDGRVQLTDAAGVPLPSDDTRRRIMGGEEPLRVARELLRGMRRAPAPYRWSNPFGGMA